MEAGESSILEALEEFSLVDFSNLSVVLSSFASDLTW